MTQRSEVIIGLGPLGGVASSRTDHHGGRRRPNGDRRGEEAS
jgi:hypothetical protein